MSAVPDANAIACMMPRSYEHGSTLAALLGIRNRLAVVFRSRNATEIRYAVPESGPVQLVYRGLPLDQIEDLLPNSPRTARLARILFASQTIIAGRPLTPLNGGHAGLLCTAGMLSGVFGEGKDRLRFGTRPSDWEETKTRGHF